MVAKESPGAAPSDDSDPTVTAPEDGADTGPEATGDEADQGSTPSAEPEATPSPAPAVAAKKVSTGDKVLDEAVERYAKIRGSGKISEGVLTQWKKFVDANKTETVTVNHMKAVFADCYILPSIQAQPAEKRDVLTLRASVAILRGKLASQNFDFELTIVSVGNVQQKAANKDKPSEKRDWRVRGAGLAVCRNTKHPFVGKVTFMTFNYADRATAAREAARMVVGRTYLYRAHLSKESADMVAKFPEGRLPMSKIGNLQGSANEPKVRELPQENGGTWGSDLYAKFAEGFPVSKLRSPLEKPVKYGTYRVAGEVTKSFVGTSKTGEPVASLSIIDDSVTGALLTKNPLGMNVFLSTHDVPKGRLAVGSSVEIICTMSPSKAKDDTGQRTGEDVWGANEITMRVDFDLTGGSEVPDGDSPAVTGPNDGDGIDRDIDSV